MKFPIKLTKTAFSLSAILFAALTFAPGAAFADRPAFDQKFLDQTARLDVEVLRTLPAHDSGRLKPLDTLARETLLYITGSRKPMGVDPLKLFINLMVEPDAAQLQLIEIRSVDLRKSLKLSEQRRHFSVHELQASGLPEMAQPLIEKQQKNSKSITPDENSTLEAYQQWSLLQAVVSGQVFLGAIDFSSLKNSMEGHGQIAPDLMDKSKALIGSVSSGKVDPGLAKDLELVIRAQEVPELFKGQIDKMGLEVTLYRSHVFWFAALMYFAAGVLLWLSDKDSRLRKYAQGALIAALGLHIVGFAVRVYITGFAPVTNMYGTMLWVSFGVALFGALLFQMYKRAKMISLLYAGAGLVLVLTEGFPLVLNPGLDPVVAVLRSNLWLTVHVLTITISYAAFTITMLLGNYAMVMNAFGKLKSEEIKDLSHHCYRMIQLGVFLLTVGIVLGGVWADYSWGRFWGWDPKETWALIADLGYLAILHARITGWVSPLGILLASPVAYLLVIMAWYGVNFVLAAGLHSYGFSKGGATWVGIFVGLQVILAVASIAKWKLDEIKTAKNA